MDVFSKVQKLTSNNAHTERVFKSGNTFFTTPFARNEVVIIEIVPEDTKELAAAFDTALFENLLQKYCWSFNVRSRVYRITLDESAVTKKWKQMLFSLYFFSICVVSVGTQYFTTALLVTIKQVRQWNCTVSNSESESMPEVLTRTLICILGRDYFRFYWEHHLSRFKQR